MTSGKQFLNLKEVVSRNLRILRLEKGLTQKEVAEKAGYHVTYYARLESDPQNISLNGTVWKNFRWRWVQKVGNFSLRDFKRKIK